MTIQFADQEIDNPFKIHKASGKSLYAHKRIIDDYKQLDDDYMGSHIAKCVGLTSITSVGWYCPTRYNIHLKDGKIVHDETCNSVSSTHVPNVWDEDIMAKFFPEWKDTIIIKVPLGYMIYLDDEYDMVLTPPAFIEQEGWHSIPGVLKNKWGPITLSAFISTTKKDLFIPAGDPIMQLMFLPRSQPQVTVRDYDVEDNVNNKMSWKWHVEHPKVKERKYTQLGDLPWYHMDD